MLGLRETSKKQTRQQHKLMNRLVYVWPSSTHADFMSAHPVGEFNGLVATESPTSSLTLETEPTSPTCMKSSTHCMYFTSFIALLGAWKFQVIIQFSTSGI